MWLLCKADVVDVALDVGCCSVCDVDSGGDGGGDDDVMLVGDPLLSVVADEGFPTPAS